MRNTNDTCTQFDEDSEKTKSEGKKLIINGNSAKTSRAIDNLYLTPH